MALYFLLITALSLDTFLAAFSYGTEKIKVPMKSNLTISLICSTVILLALTMGEILQPILPKDLLKTISVVTLLLIGISKLLEEGIKKTIRKRARSAKEISFSCFNLNFILSIYSNYKEADKDLSKSLSIKEAISLSLALSLDGLTGGIAFGLVPVKPLSIFLWSLSINIIFILVAHYLGEKISKRIPIDISWISGAIFIILAFTRLF